MHLFKAATTMCFAALMGAVVTPNAQADDWSRKTAITFGAPVGIPGVHLVGWGVLPAGASLFKILDSQSDRHSVQIFNRDQTTIYATILAIPNYRLGSGRADHVGGRTRSRGDGTAPILAVQPTGEDVQVAEVVTPPPAETEVAIAPALPATASTLPLISLFGLMAWVRPSPAVALRNAFTKRA